MNERKILEQCQAARIPVPKAIRDAPELTLGQEFVYSAFWELHSCRNSGWGVGPLPWTAIFDYAAAHELDPDDREDFVYFIRAMDDEFLAYHSRKQASEAKEKPKGGK